VSRNVFNSLITPRFVQRFSGNSYVNLFAVYRFKYKLLIKILSLSLNSMLIIDKRCSDICCDEFSMPQIDRKSKYPKEQWHKNLFAMGMGKDIPFLSTENIKICGRTT